MSHMPLPTSNTGFVTSTRYQGFSTDTTVRGSDKIIVLYQNNNNKINQACPHKKLRDSSA